MRIEHPRRVTLSGWTGGTTGLRVDNGSWREVFLPMRETLRRVRLVLPGHPVQPQCRVTPSFWTGCPELRSAEIGRWMEERDDMPWRYRRPPRYEAEFLALSAETGGSACADTGGGRSVSNEGGD